MRKDVREGVRKFMNDGIKPNFAHWPRQRLAVARNEREITRNVQIPAAGLCR